MVERPAFASVVVDRKKAKILSCHVVGERAVEIAQVAAIAMSAGLGVVDLARVPQAFPTYTGNLVYAAAGAARELEVDVDWHGSNLATNATRTGSSDSHRNKSQALGASDGLHSLFHL
jgi:hypothetical protein